MKEISHPRFATYYNRAMKREPVRRIIDPLRQEIISQAKGIVLEVGAGGGQNFPFYDASRVRQVEAIEPDANMLEYANQQLHEKTVPINLVHASVETIPFPDAHFDSVVATLVFCSVQDPDHGLREIWRVLKPGGSLLLLEHVRAHNTLLGWTQDLLVPLTTRLLGNCHWNRDTRATVLATGFTIISSTQKGGQFQPMLLLHASRNETEQ